MKRIVFGITSLQIGGAERVLVDLCNRLTKENKYDITIFTLYDNGPMKNDLLPEVKVKSIYSKRYEEFNKFQKIMISLKLIFTKPPEGFDTYVAFLEGPITRLFAKNKYKEYSFMNEGNNKKRISKINKKDIRKIAWVHNDISKVFGRGIKSKLKSKIDGNLYTKYDKIVFVSDENKKDFEKIYGKQISKKEAKLRKEGRKGNFLEVIRNYLNYKNVIKKSKENAKLEISKNDINLVSVCRLVDQKAIDRFIKVHSRLEKNGVHCKVYIIGEGPLHYDLQKLIDSLGETENFYLLGARENPYPYIKNADYFCLLSYYEGYGMVIDEAKILNKEIVITNTAAVESLEDYKNKKILDNNENSIYNGLRKILTNYQNDKKNLQKETDEEYINKIDNYYEGIIKSVEEILD